MQVLGSPNELRAALSALPLSRALAIAANVVLGVLWLWLYRAVFDYLAIIFTREDFRTNQIALIGVIVLFALQLRREHARPPFDAAPQPQIVPLVLVVVGSLGYLLVERWLDINTISASLFGLASYGLLGLWLNESRWRAGLPAALLVIGILPFGEHMQTFIGYPMRIVTASLVRDALASAGVASLGVDTILVFENSVSQVDLACSGVKSLWTGALFLLAATWVERRAIDARWFVVAGAFALILFVTNLARVAILVVVGEVLGARLVAEMMHVPLGVLGFVAACAAAAILLRGLSSDNGTRTSADERGEKSNPRLSAREAVRVQFFSVFLAATFLALGLLYAPRPQTGLAQIAPTWNLPGELRAQVLPLKPDEIAALVREDAESADRFQFAWRGITGSLILVPSTTWRAHHRPERCLEVLGLKINDSRAVLIAPDFSVRFVAVGQRSGDDLSATYWFQSATRVTDDYGTRMWADLTPRRERWVLVSVLFDRALDPHDADVRAFYLALRDGIAQNLNR